MSNFPSFEQLLDSKYIEKNNNKEKILLVSSKSSTIQQVSKTYSFLGNLLISRKTCSLLGNLSQ